MRILIRSTVSLVIVSFLLGCNQELLIKSIVSLVLLGTLTKCTYATLATPYLPTHNSSTEALPLTIDQPLSTRAAIIYQRESLPVDFRDRVDNSYFSGLPTTKYTYV
jgi:hypothetical protein